MEKRQWTFSDIDHGLPIVLCGEPVLCQRYAQALVGQGLAPPDIRASVTPSGLWLVAKAAGLLQSP